MNKKSCLNFTFLLQHARLLTNAKPFVKITCVTNSIINKNTLKVGPSPSKKNCFICFNESPLRMIKNGFLFQPEIFLFSRYLNFCLRFLVM